MGIFIKDKKIEAAPRTAGSVAGEEFLTSKLGQAPDMPQQGIAGLTPMQQLIQSRLGSMLSNVEEGGTAASDYYRNLLSDDYDVTQDPRYLAAKDVADVQGRTAANAAARKAEGAGMLQSAGPGGASQHIFDAYQDSATSPLLGVMSQLLSNRESLQAGAAEGVGRTAGQQLQNVAAVGGISDQARAIEQAGNDALFQYAMQTVLFPYQQQANIASSLMNFKPDTFTTGGGLTDLGFATNATIEGAKAAATAAAGA